MAHTAPTRHRTRGWLLALMLVVAALVAACGGSSDKGGGSTGASSSSDGKVALGAAGTDGKGASAIPGDALAFASANIDEGSAAWKQLTATASKFPGWAQVSADFQKQLSGSGAGQVDFQTDVKPWLGGEIAVGVTAVDVSNPQKPSAQAVVYVQSKDDAKAIAALQKGGKATPGPDYAGYKTFSDTSGSSPMYAAVGKGAVLISTTQLELQRAIDTRDKGTGSLAQSPAFQTAMSKLPSDNLAVGYVAGDKLAPLVKALAQSASQAGSGTAASATAALQGQMDKALAQLAGIKSISMAFRAEEKGFRFEEAVVGDPATLAQAGGTFEPKLTARVPGDAVAYVAFKDLGKSLQPAIDQVLASNAQAKDQLAQMEAVLGLSVKDDVIPILLNEHAIWVGGGAPLGAGLLLTPTDTAAAAKTLKQLGALVGQTGQATVSDVPGGQKLDLTSQGMSLYWRQVDDVVSLSNVATAGDKPASSLADSDAYKTALADAGVKFPVTALAYVDVPGALRLAKSTGAQYSPSSDANLAPLKGIVAWGSVDGDTARGDLFVGVG